MRNRWFLIAVMCVFSSCAHVEKAAEPPKIAKPVDIASPVSMQMEKEKSVEAVKSKEMFSFSFREADVRDILRAIGKQTNYNVVMEPDVKGTCTVDLKNVTLEKALEYILEPLNYAYKIDDKTIYVSKPKLETKIFHVNYISLEKKGTSVVAWKVGGETTTGTSSASTTSSDKALEVVNTTISDLWKSLDDNVKNILSPDGKFIVNRQAFMIFVTDYPKNIKRVGAFLEAIERAIHRQIMIEAKIVEVILNDSSSQGVNWKFIETKIGNFAKISGQQVLLTTTPAPTQYFRFYVGSPSSGQLDITNTFVELLKTQGEVKTLSNPKIATLNNQRAVIKDTTQEVYFDAQQSATTVGGLATYTAKFMNIGIILDVTPQIDNNGNIVLSIHPAYSLLERWENSPDPNSRGRVPVVSTREADTVVRVKDGETVVIGGLIYERKSTEKGGTPGLMSVPFFGALFRTKSDEFDRRELVVFLTPRIIYDNDKEKEKEQP